MSSNTPAVVVDDFEFDFDLDSARAAAAEAVGHKPAIKLPNPDGGEPIRVELPVELPLDVLQPLVNIDVDLSILIRQALDARKEGSTEDIVSAVVDMLVVNPALPRDLVEAATTMARRLVGSDEAYDRLCAARMSIPEIGRLVKYLGRRYGVGLGEASPSSDSSEGTGTTSRPTGPAATPAKTSGRSGGSRARSKAS